MNSFISQAPIPEWVRPAEKIEELSRPNLIALLFDSQFYLSRNSRTCYRQRAFQANNRQELDVLNCFEVEYDESIETLDVHFVRQYRNNTWVDITNKVLLSTKNQKHTSDTFQFNGVVSQEFRVPDVKVGDIVTWCYSITNTCPLLSMEASVPCENSFSLAHDRIRFVSDFEEDLNIGFNNQEIMPVLSQSPFQAPSGKTYKETLFEFYDAPPLPSEAGMPSWFSRNTIFVSLHKEWKEYVDFHLDNYADTEIPESLLNVLNEIETNYSTIEDRITASIDFVQKEITYVTFESFAWGRKPFPLEKTIATRMGDCKNKTYVLITMLRHFGVESYPALQSYIRPPSEFPPACIFDHILVYFLFEGKDYWIETTNSYQEGPFTQRIKSGPQVALILRKGNNALTPLPEGPGSSLVYHETFDFSQDPQKVFLTVNTYFKSDSADNVRLQFEDISIENRSSGAITFYKDPYPSIEFTKELEFIDHKVINMVQINEFYVFNSQDLNVDEDGYFGADLHAFMRPLNVELQDSPRIYPMHLHHPYQVKHQIDFIYPEDWNFEKETMETVVDNKFFKAIRLQNLEGQGISLEAKYTSKSFSVAPEEYEDFRREYTEAGRLNSMEYRMPHEWTAPESSTETLEEETFFNKISRGIKALGSGLFPYVLGVILFKILRVAFSE